MEARLLPHTGKQVLVQDLTEPFKWLNACLNVIGRLDEHDASRCQVKLVDPKTKDGLLVDTTLVEPLDARIGSLCQFIGEMRWDDRRCGKMAVLQARIVRNSDRLDLSLYEHALKTQRDFMNSR